MSDQRDLAMSLMPDQGIYDALNKGVHMATGDVIGFLHADDFLASSNVLSRIACAFENTGTEAVYGGTQYVKRLASGEFDLVRHRTSCIYHIRKLRWSWMPPHTTLYLKREIYERAKMDNGEYFDTNFSCAADYDFMRRIHANFGVKPAYLKKVLVRMRVGGISNRSIKYIVLKSKEDW